MENEITTVVLPTHLLIHQSNSSEPLLFQRRHHVIMIKIPFITSLPGCRDDRQSQSFSGSQQLSLASHLDHTLMLS